MGEREGERKGEMKQGRNWAGGNSPNERRTLERGERERTRKKFRQAGAEWQKVPGDRKAGAEGKRGPERETDGDRLGLGEQSGNGRQR